MVLRGRCGELLQLLLREQHLREGTVQRWLTKLRHRMIGGGEGRVVGHEVATLKLLRLHRLLCESFSWRERVDRLRRVLLSEWLLQSIREWLLLQLLNASREWSAGCELMLSKLCCLQVLREVRSEHGLITRKVHMSRVHLLLLRLLLRQWLRLQGRRDGKRLLLRPMCLRDWVRDTREWVRSVHPGERLRSSDDRWL